MLYMFVRLPVNVTRYVFVGVALAFVAAIMIGKVLLFGALGYLIFGVFIHESAIFGLIGAILGSAFGLWSVDLLVTEKTR